MPGASYMVTTMCFKPSDQDSGNVSDVPDRLVSNGGRGKCKISRSSCGLHNMLYGSTSTTMRSCDDLLVRVIHPEPLRQGRAKAAIFSLISRCHPVHVLMCSIGAGAGPKIVGPLCGRGLGGRKNAPQCSAAVLTRSPSALKTNVHHTCKWRVPKLFPIA